MFGQLRKFALRFAEGRLGSFITIHLRPIRSADFKLTSLPTPSLPPYAVVLRGPIVIENDFTLETLRMYAKLFPGAPLIVSTWRDTPEAVLAPLRTVEGVEIVLSKQPPHAAYGHANFQITLAAAGINKAKELGAAYILKTRTDQRLYATDLYPFLLGLLQSFPLTQQGVQRERLVALGFSTIKYRAYSLNDMLFFGNASDMQLYWDIPHDARDIKKVFTVGDWSSAKVCEGYFLTTFLDNIGHTVQDSLADFWHALGSYFILIDNASIDLYWPKYARYQEYRYRRYDKVVIGEEIGFKEWLNFYHHYYDPKRIPKNIGGLPNDTHNTEVHFE